jgi:DNA-directed RNA polymerase subunit M/transcription elongation factor TFIIS
MGLPKLNTPTYTMTIPSSKKEVKYRPYLVKEEKVLMIAMESDDGLQINNAIKEVINACTFGEIDSNKLTMFDVEYMFTKLRAKSVGESSTVMVPCTKCEAPNEATIDLEKDLVVGEVPDNRIELSSDTGLIMKFPAMVDYIELAGEEGISDIDKIFSLIAISIESIYSGDDVYDASSQTKAEMLEFVENLSSEQFVRIKHYLDMMPSAKVDAKFKCKECGHENVVELRGLRNFFS